MNIEELKIGDKIIGNLPNSYEDVICEIISDLKDFRFKCKTLTKGKIQFGWIPGLEIGEEFIINREVSSAWDKI